jgi:hypothetical protein
MLFVLFILSLCTGQAFASHPPGQRLNDALVVDLTKHGFSTASEVAPKFVPESADIPDIHQNGKYLYLNWFLDIVGLTIYPEVESLSITPAQGHLDIQGAVRIAVNNPSNPANVQFRYAGVKLTDCDMYIEPFNAYLQTKAYPSIVTDSQGRKRLHVFVGAVDWTWDLTGSHIKAQNCFLGSLDTVLDTIGISIFGLAVGPLETAVDNQIRDLVDALGPTLEQAFNNLRLERTFEFNGAQIDVLLEPDKVDVVSQGMRVSMAGRASADPHTCIGDKGTSGSKSTPSSPPNISTSPSFMPQHDVGLFGSDDFVNQVLYAAYRGGILCYDLEGQVGPLTLNTAVLGMLAPGAFDELFPQPKPVKISVRPVRPPEAKPDGVYDVTLEATDLSFEVYAELDGRMANMIGIDIDAIVGADLLFNGTSGRLDLDIALSGNNLSPKVRPNEIVPGIEGEIAQRFGGLFDSLAGPLIGDALSGLSFTVPSFGGFGVTSLAADSAGPSQDWFGFYAHAGEVPYGSGGCTDDGGCDSGADGCAEGCNPIGASGRGLALIVLPLIVASLRRRR